MKQQDENTIIDQIKESKPLQFTIILPLIIIGPILGFINPIKGLGTWVLIIIPLLVLIIEDLDQLGKFQKNMYHHKYFLLYTVFIIVFGASYIFVVFGASYDLDRALLLSLYPIYVTFLIGPAFLYILNWNQRFLLSGSYFSSYGIFTITGLLLNGFTNNEYSSLLIHCTISIISVGLIVYVFYPELRK